ncbi:phage tail protein, partial [Escherichia coli]|nr:phage tail protein [Escherichia coli]
GVIPLAGAVIEVFNNGSSSNNYTIRITTATTTSVSGALTNAEFIYVFNGTDYSPGWRRVYNTKNKPTASDVGALPLTGGTLSGGLTSSGEIVSKYANGFRIAYGSFGFFIRNDGGSTYFMLTASGDTLGSWNGLRPITINNTSGVVSIGNGLNVTGGVNGSLNGNASTATKLQTARNINGVKFDGSGDININTLVSRGRVTALSGSTQGTAGIQMYEAYNNSYPTTYGNVLHMKGASAAGEGELLIGWSGTSGAHAPVFIRSRRDTTDAAWSAWAQVYTAKDSIPGVNTTGNQNTTGNAATATKLQTARKIAGVAFDGSADITLTAANLNAYTKTEVTNLLSSYVKSSSLPSMTVRTSSVSGGDMGMSLSAFISHLKSNGAFSKSYWIGFGDAMGFNAGSINNITGFGAVELAESIIEVFNLPNGDYTIRLTTSHKADYGGITNAILVYHYRSNRNPAGQWLKFAGTLGATNN